MIAEYDLIEMERRLDELQFSVEMFANFGGISDPTKDELDRMIAGVREDFERLEAEARAKC